MIKRLNLTEQEINKVFNASIGKPLALDYQSNRIELYYVGEENSVEVILIKEGMNINLKEWALIGSTKDGRNEMLFLFKRNVDGQAKVFQPNQKPFAATKGTSGLAR